MNVAIIHKTRLDARAPLAPDRPRHRKPLGLAPVLDDADEPAAVRAAPRTASEDPLAAVISELIDTLEDTRKHFELKVAHLETRLAKVEGENEALRLVQESLRISTRGEPGVQGPRGSSGRDGLQGPIGPQGPVGAAGKDAPTLVTWLTDDAQFTAWPLFSNGAKPAGKLSLRGMFETYHRQAEEAEEDESSP